MDTIENHLLGEPERWIAAFGEALQHGDADRLKGQFASESYWRDLIALTWHIDTLAGPDAIAHAIVPAARGVEATGFGIDKARTPPRLVTRAGHEVIEAIFAFRTRHGSAGGVLRLVPAGDGEAMKAWTLSTVLHELDETGERAPALKPFSRDFRGPNWLDHRLVATAFDCREPEVLIVGGGQAGLATAARLGQLGIDTLLIDKNARTGDNWRKRYHALSLHNRTKVNHLPFMPFPDHWPAYLPKDKLAGWFEAYVEAMEINAWAGTTLSHGTYDQSVGRWSVALERSDGCPRMVRPRHIVMATGASAIPNRPEIPTIDAFAGTVVHSADYGDAARWAGKNAIVLGTGTSGHDIAQDLHSNGAHVSIIQRGPSMVIDIEPSAQAPYALYDEGIAVSDCDLIAASTPFPVLRRAHQLITEETTKADKAMLDRLREVGFALDFNHDGSGWQFMYMERGGGYYFNVGCSDLVAEGAIGLLQSAEIEGFVADGLRLRDGSTVAADLIVLATGYLGQDAMVRKLFGDSVADRVGPIWGFGENGLELRNMYTRTPQPGLWFIAGSFPQCRIWSHYMSLQIKACLDGTIACAFAPVMAKGET